MICDSRPARGPTCFFYCLLVLPAAGGSWAAAQDGPALAVNADFRFRAENDWDSLRPDGTMRDNRDRYRIRLRLGAEYTFAETWRLGARIRTGNNASQQSPHITILDNDNPEGDAEQVAVTNAGEHERRHNHRDQWTNWVNSLPLPLPRAVKYDSVHICLVAIVTRIPVFIRWYLAR